MEPLNPSVAVDHSSLDSGSCGLSFRLSEGILCAMTSVQRGGYCKNEAKGSSTIPTLAY